MKNLSAISKKGIIVISAVSMIMAGAFVALLPSTSRACGGGDVGDYTSYVHVPILNNTGKTMIIFKMFIDGPDVGIYKMHSWTKELRVKAITFGGVSYYTAAVGSTVDSHCHRYSSADDIIDKTITLDTVGGIAGYPFEDSKIECKIAFDVVEADLSGDYTIILHFRFDNDEVGTERTNEITFTL
ncbi:MAG: hypothetical protein L6406_00075 [Desulfobacterales bacterium]|nr:hypothetical protein [Pseudomonadota bacterium]MCG2774051.1 hypothetical protein [Desulfobacterales bacterium]